MELTQHHIVSNTKECLYQRNSEILGRYQKELVQYSRFCGLDFATWDKKEYKT